MRKSAHSQPKFSSPLSSWGCHKTMWRGGDPKETRRAWLSLWLRPQDPPWCSCVLLQAANTNGAYTLWEKTGAQLHTHENTPKEFLCSCTHTEMFSHSEHMFHASFKQTFTYTSNPHRAAVTQQERENIRSELKWLWGQNYSSAPQQSWTMMHWTGKA